MKYFDLFSKCRPSSHWTKLLATGLMAAALVGCGGGSDGAPGATGPAGPAGATGPTGPGGADKTTGTVDATTLTFNDLRDRALAVAITSADTSADKPVVKFKVTMKDSGEGVRGLRTFTLQLAQLKPEKDGSASYWQNYISRGLPLTAVPAFTERGASVQTAPVNPAADGVTVFNANGTVKAQGYTVVDNGDGSYVVTFGANVKANTNVPYDATLTHRVGVGVRSVVVPGVVGKTAGAYAGPINPTTGAVFAQFTNTNGAVDVYDFTPSASGAGTKLAAAARDNVTVAACNQCHYKIEYGFPKGNNTSGHFGARPDTKFCVMCHTPQNFDPADKANTLVDFTPFIHKIHMGEELPVAETNEWINYAEIKYPQDQRNCTTCHKGTVTDNWKKPTLKACGACHNNVDFSTGTGHIGGAKADDKTCALCHDGASIATYHVPVGSVTSATSGIASRYAHNANLPAGAYKIEYVINSVTLDSARKPSVKFGVKKNGALVNFGAYNAATNPNIIANTVGGPSIAIAYNVSQDGITSPADFNARLSVPAIGLAAPTVTSSTATPAATFTPAATSSSLWASGGTLTASGVTWTLTGPDSIGYYTVSSSVALPASTTMVSALMYGGMTQTNVADYPFAAASKADFKAYAYSATETRYAISKPGLVIAPANALKAAAGTGLTARRTIVDNAKCNSCHEQLGLFTKSAFHGGARNDGTACNFCHTPNGANGGWSYSFNTFIHGIHGAANRTNDFAWQPSFEFWKVGYPGLLKNCEQCHRPGTYDFSATDSAAAVNKLLYNTVATGSMTPAYPAQTAAPYGTGFSAATSTGAVVTTEAAPTTLVSSPISAACFSCHDSGVARSHMKSNGGSLYEDRATALSRKESCLVCHGAASSTNGTFNDSTPAIKSVHRWW